MTTSQTRAHCAIALFLCIHRAAYGAGELEGQIRGQVSEAATNAPVPGATVTVTSSNLGEPRMAVTDENGEYLITNLPIGHYRLTVSYPGVEPITREILVQPGVTSAVDIKWSAELAEAETTTVFEQRPVTNPDSTQTGAIISPEQLRYLPASNRRFTDAMLFVPGVTRGGTSFNFVKGGRSSDNRYLIDGLDITDPVSRLVPATTVCDNNTGLISDYREPPRVQVDLHLEYDFYELLRQHIALNLEFLNIFNDRSATGLQEADTASGQFGLASGRNTGLIVRFGARYDF